MNYKYKILMVSSAESTRQMLIKQLNKFGYDVTVMDNGKEVIQQLENENFNLILLDQTLPDMDGLETFHNLKLRDLSSALPPVIMITAQDSLNWAMKFMQAQGNDYVEQPIDIGVLDTKIRRALTLANVYKAFQEEINISKQEEKRLSTAVIELERASREAHIANQARSEFLTIMSHELRTPLHGILSFATFGIRKYRTEDPDRLFEYFRHIEQCGRTLLQLLDDLLDLAKFEAGKMTFDFNATNVSHIVTSAIEEFQTLCLEKRIIIQYIELESPKNIIIDSMRIRQIVRHLLSNAIKFSPPDGIITVELTLQVNRIRICISDQGTGIPENELEFVFKNFTQSTKTQYSTGGTGLGLRICKEIIIAHSGRIWAENNSNCGTTFTFEIPMDLKEGQREINTCT